MREEGRIAAGSRAGPLANAVDVDWEALDLEDLAAMEEDEDVVYVIHAMPMTARMRSQYRRQRGP